MTETTEDTKMKEQKTDAIERPLVPLHVALSRAAQWLRDTNEHYTAQASERLDLLEAELPHGSGIDSGTKVNREKSNNVRLVLETSYHHINGNGFYDGWTDHTITIKPSLTYGFDMRISGTNRNGIKEYLGQVYEENLRHLVNAHPEA